MNRSISRPVLGFVSLAVPLLALAACQCCCPRDCAVASAGATPSLIVQNSPPPTTNQVFVDIEIYRIAAEGWERRKASLPVVEGRTYGLLSKIDAVTLRRSLRTGPGVEVVAMPKILALAGQEATILVGESIAPDASGGTGAESLSFSVERDNWTGMRAKVIPTTSADGANVTMAFSFALREPIVEGKVDLVASKAGERAVRVEALTVASGETAFLLAGPTTAGAGTPHVVFVTPTVLRSEDVAQAVVTPPSSSLSR